MFRIPRSLWRLLVLFAFLCTYLVVLFPWHGFADPDAFYHATVSQEIWRSGPVQHFPALDLTLVGQSFADLHFGFHVFVAPFTAILGPLSGIRVATLVLSLIFFAVFYVILRREKIAHAEWWVVLLALSAPFLFRLVLGKATPLALLCQLVGTWAVLRRKWWLAFFAGAGFALSHGGWPYLAGSALLILVSEYLYDRVVAASTVIPTDESVRSGGIPSKGSSPRLSREAGSLGTTGSLRLPYKEVIAVWGGVIVGLLLHPNRANILSFAWTQIVTIGLGTPINHVALGKEWLPADPATVLSSLAPWAILLLLGVLGICLAPRKSFDEAHARGALAFAIISSVLVALSFKSWRNVEYLVPMACLALASLWELIDIQRLSVVAHSVIPTEESATNGGIPSKGSLGFVRLRSGRQVTWILFISLFFLLSAQATFALWRGFHPAPFPDSLFRDTMHEISARAAPGDRVFHVWWDDFPILFAADDRLQYISGLDPTFLYVVNPALSDELHALMQHPASSTQEAIWHVVHDETRSRFILLDARRDGRLQNIIENDPRYAKIGQDSGSTAWEVK